MQKKQFKSFFLALDLLQKAFFADCLEEHGKVQAILKARAKLYSAVTKIRSQYPKYDASILEKIYETIFLMGLLRFRIVDRALFVVCRQELATLSAAVSNVLKAAINKKSSHALIEFDQGVDAFQMLFEKILCVTAQEPAVFEIFFTHLAAFRREIVRWVEET